MKLALLNCYETFGEKGNGADCMTAGQGKDQALTQVAVVLSIENAELRRKTADSPQGRHSEWPRLNALTFLSRRTTILLGFPFP